MTIADVVEGRKAWHVEGGADCLDVLRTIPTASVDAIVTDPPAGIGFMGKTWDSDHGGRDKWIEMMADRFREALRVLKPGGHALVWALPRTSHWTGLALESAGFEVRDRVSHIFGSGFPKSLNVGKMIDKEAGAEREIIGTDPARASRLVNQRDGYKDGTWDTGPRSIETTAPATDDAKAWDGWGTALKPAVEDWWLCRKPFRQSVAKNVLEHGTGAINVGACRVAHASEADFDKHAAGVAAIKARGGTMDNSWANHSDLAGASDVTKAGRWPAHVVLSHAEGCQLVGTKKVKAAPSWNDNRSPSLFTGAETSPVHHADDDGTETIQDWQCVEACPVRYMDRQSGATADTSHDRGSGLGYMGASASRGVVGHNDEGGASRYFTTFAPFFYTPKADRVDRENGCEHLPPKTAGELTERVEGSPGINSPRAGAGRRSKGRRNHHPTVKSTELMRWLVRLVTPPRGIVLDPFTGSGSTGVACSAEGFRFIGIELDLEYAEIARARIVGDAPLFNVGGLQ